jgi:hypothetical protein
MSLDHRVVDAIANARVRETSSVVGIEHHSHATSSLSRMNSIRRVHESASFFVSYGVRDTLRSHHSFFTTIGRLARRPSSLFRG